MPDKHLFVNYSHYQDRPDQNMRHQMASHAARYGPNGALAFRTSPEGMDKLAEQSMSSSSSRHSWKQVQSSQATKLQRSASINSSPVDTAFRKDYEMILARFDDFCACAGSLKASNAKPEVEVVHSEECSLLEDYLDLSAQHELPFRVWSFSQARMKQDGLVTQCLLVAVQAAIDGLDPNFKGKASKQTLTLQQKALGAMQKLIAKRPNIIDDSLVFASAVLMATAAFFDDTDAYKAHKSSLQKMIDMQGGNSQTDVHRIVQAISGAGDVSLAMCRYLSSPRQGASSKKATTSPQNPAQAPLKLKYPMLPFVPEVARSIERLSPGFQALANSSKLCMQALQLITLATKWSVLIDHPANSETEQKQLLSNTAGANARMLDLYTDSIETKRQAAFLLISLPIEAAHMKLEKCLCLGLLNLLHSMSLWQHPIPVRNRLTLDFTEGIFSLAPKDKNEEDCMIWLVLAVASEWRHCAAKLNDLTLLARHGHDAAVLCQVWMQKSRQIMDWVIVKWERARAWEGVAAICARFLWLRRMNGEWRLTWTEAMERRLRNMPRQKSQSPA